MFGVKLEMDELKQPDEETSTFRGEMSTAGLTKNIKGSRQSFPLLIQVDILYVEGVMEEGAPWAMVDCGWGKVDGGWLDMGRWIGVVDGGGGWGEVDGGRWMGGGEWGVRMRGSNFGVDWVFSLKALETTGDVVCGINYHSLIAIIIIIVVIIIIIVVVVVVIIIIILVVCD